MSDVGGGYRLAFKNALADWCVVDKQALNGLSKGGRQMLGENLGNGILLGVEGQHAGADARMNTRDGSGERKQAVPRRRACSEHLQQSILLNLQALAGPALGGLGDHPTEGRMN